MRCTLDTHVRERADVGRDESTAGGDASTEPTRWMPGARNAPFAMRRHEREFLHVLTVDQGPAREARRRRVGAVPAARKHRSRAEA